MAENTHLACPNSRPDRVGSDMENITLQVARLPLTQPDRAEKQLAALLQAALESDTGARELFFLLEYIRSPLSFVREAAIRHYHAQAPMLDKDSEAHFRHGIDAWQRMIRGYSLCLGKAGSGQPSPLAEHVATIAHRCLFYQGMLIFEHYRAKRQLPPGIWRRFHNFYATVEKLSLNRQAVQDELFGEVRVTDCQAAYIAPLLIHAANPFGRESRQLEAIGRWSAQWSHLAGIGTADTASGGSGFLLDLDRDASRQQEAGASPGPKRRLLHTATLVAHLRRILDLLGRRPPPECFGLSEDNIFWTRPLLVELERTWTPNPECRHATRISHKATLSLSVGFEHIHTRLSGPQAYRAGQSTAAPEQERTDEDWLLVEESPDGCRLVHPAPGIHLHIHQLLALHDRGSGADRLGRTQWLMQDSLGGIVAGVALLPGKPRAVSLRGDRSMNGRAHFLGRAFLLSGEPGAPSSIVLPQGIFKAERLVEIPEWRGETVMLTEVLHRGSDFEHAAIQTRSAPPGDASASR